MKSIKGPPGNPEKLNLSRLYPIGPWVPLLLMICMVLPTASDAAGGAGSRKSLETIQTQFTPVLISVLAAPHPFPGSDGLIHFVYELQVTNAMSFAVRLESVEVLDGADPERILATFTALDLQKRMQGLTNKSPTDTLEPGQGAIIFLHFQTAKPQTSFSTLVHRLTISGEFPHGLLRFMGVPTSESRIVQIGGPTKLDSLPPIRIGSPLEGGRWIAADGCCVAERHLRALMPINGKLYLAQRFAIDWELLNKNHQLFVGEPADVRSYLAYGRKVLAVADATVVAAVDEYRDQIPGKLPPDLPLAEVGGNHIVLDLGNGHFAFYAHLQPGSIKASGIKVGDRVCRGEVLGFVGNSGNSSAPHLHFHIMSSPSPLGANGLPYTIDEFKLLERGVSTEAFDAAEQEGTSLVLQGVENSGTHSNELPLDLHIVAFPSQATCVASP